MRRLPEMLEVRRVRTRYRLRVSCPGLVPYEPSLKFAVPLGALGSENSAHSLLNAHATMGKHSTWPIFDNNHAGLYARIANSAASSVFITWFLCVGNAIDAHKKEESYPRCIFHL